MKPCGLIVSCMPMINILVEEKSRYSKEENQ